MFYLILLIVFRYHRSYVYVEIFEKKAIEKKLGSILKIIFLPYPYNEGLYELLKLDLLTAIISKERFFIKPHSLVDVRNVTI